MGPLDGHAAYVTAPISVCGLAACGVVHGRCERARKTTRAVIDFSALERWKIVGRQRSWLPLSAAQGRGKIDIASMSEGSRNVPEQGVVRSPTPSQGVERALPRVDKALLDAGFSPEERDEWMRRLGQILDVSDVSEDEVVSLVTGDLAPHTHSYLRRQLNIWRHELARWWNHRNPLVRLVYGVGWLVVLVGAAVQSGLSVAGYITAGAVLMVKVWTSLQELDPKHLPALRRGRTERQLLLEKLVHTTVVWLSRPPSPRELREFQQDVLGLIASYVRDHRSDLKGRKIFVNLLVPDGDGLTVIARSDDQRPVPQRYAPDECLVMWKALHTGRAQCSGDIYEDCPKTPKGKPYRSVLAIPIKLDKRVVGGVSVDSAAKYHFDRYVDELQVELAPYVQLLAVTLPGSRGTQDLVTELSVSGEGDRDDGNPGDP